MLGIFDRLAGLVAGLLWYGVKHPIKALKIIAPILGVLFVIAMIGQCSGGA